MRDWSHTSSIARRLLWWRRSLHRSPDDRVRGGDPFIDRRTIVFAEAISSSIAGRSCSRRRSLHRSPDDRVRGGDLFIDRRTIVFAEAIPSSIAGRSCSRRRSLLHTRLWVWGNCGAAARKIANLKKALDGLYIRHIF